MNQMLDNRGCGKKGERGNGLPDLGESPLLTTFKKGGKKKKISC